MLPGALYLNAGSADEISDHEKHSLKYKLSPRGIFGFFPIK